MVKKYPYKIIFISIAGISVLLCSHAVFAADINIVSSSTAGRYDVMLSTDADETINAVEGTILFDENSMVAPHIEKGQSIIPLWITEPAVSGNSINFSGIIPGGFSVLYDQFGAKPQREGKLFSIIFPFAKNVASYTFTLDSISVYRNDGHGLAIIIPSKSITLPAAADTGDIGNNNLTHAPGSTAPVQTNAVILFIAFLVVLLPICYYLIRKTHRHMRKILKK